MKRILPLAALLLLLSMSGAGRPELIPPGEGYVNALRVADEFLQAWSDRDSGTGLDLMSHRLRSNLDEADLRQYIEGPSNPHHHSFEIGEGAAVDSVRFSFPVVFYAYCLGEPGAYRSSGMLEVVRQRNTWRVDSLPPEGR